MIYTKTSATRGTQTDAPPSCWQGGGGGLHHTASHQRGAITALVKRMAPVPGRRAHDNTHWCLHVLPRSRPCAADPACPAAIPTASCSGRPGPGCRTCRAPLPSSRRWTWRPWLQRWLRRSSERCIVRTRGRQADPPAEGSCGGRRALRGSSRREGRGWQEEPPGLVASDCVPAAQCRYTAGIGVLDLAYGKPQMLLT